MRVPLYNAAGEKIGTVDLNDAVFHVRVQPELVQRAVRAQQTQSRQAVAHTKVRSEVRGGGKKPWRQKGTGRARHGSIRSPLWVGGGVTFGPRSDRQHAIAINKKEARKALCMALSDKAEQEKVVIMDTLEIAEAKTKHLVALMKKLPVKGASTLLVQATPDTALWKAARNLPLVHTIAANSLNLLDILRHTYLLMPKASIDVLEKTFGSKRK